MLGNKAAHFNEVFKVCLVNGKFCLICLGMQIIDQALLAHVVDNLTGGIIDTEIFVEFAFLALFAALQCVGKFIEIIRADGIELFISLAQQLRVNRHFLFQRFVFPHGKIVAVKDIQNAVANIAFFGFVGVGKQFIGQVDIGMHPVVIADGVKESTV